MAAPFSGAPAMPGTVPVPHPPARWTDHRQCGNFRLMRQGLPLRGTR